MKVQDKTNELKQIFSSGLIIASDEVHLNAARINKTFAVDARERDKKALLFEGENLLIQLKATVEIFQNHLELEKEKFNATNT